MFIQAVSCWTCKENTIKKPAMKSASPCQKPYYMAGGNGNLWIFVGPTEDQGQLPSIRWVKLLDDFLVVQLSQFYPSSLRVGTRGSDATSDWDDRGGSRVPNWILASWGTRDSHTFLYQRRCPPQKDTKKANLFSRPATKNIQLFSNLGHWLRLPTLWE